MTVKHLYPTSTPALNLNPKSSRVADPRLSCVRNSIGTYVDPVSGLVKTAPANVARVEKGGLLVEATRTNETNNSEVFTDTGGGTGAWTANSTTAPDGNTTAYLWIPVSGFVDRNAATLSNQINGNNAVLVASVFVKKKELRYAHIALLSSATYYTRLFDLDTGEFVKEYDFGSPTKTASHVTALTNGWYRISVAKYVANTETTARLQVGSTDVSNPNHPYGQVTYTADGTSGMYFWGAQLEEWASPSSYIPTSGSTVQRLADEITLPTSGIFDPNEFTTINKPFGVAAGSDTLTIIGDGNKAECTFVYNSHLSQTQANAAAGKKDDWWEWRVLGGTFGLPGLYTDGQVSIDWGDGSAIETYAQSDSGGVTHTFTNGSGYHIIKFRLDSGTYIRPYVFNDATHKDKVISIGPCPNSMTVNTYRAFYGCTNLETFDSRIVQGGSTNMSSAWRECNSLLNAPFVDISGTTNLTQGWYNCRKLTSFPTLNTSGVTNFNDAWFNCDKLTSFPFIDTSNGTQFGNTWSYCRDLITFPSLDLSNGTSFAYCWRECNDMSTFMPTDFSSGTNFQHAWNASGVTAFQNGLTFVNATNFNQCWANCGQLVTFPANAFNNWTGTPSNGCFVNAWFNCNSLSATSVENILNSIDASGQSAPSSNVDITIKYQVSSGTPNISTAVTNLKNRNWTITLNGVLQ